LYIKRLSDIDLSTLKKLIRASVKKKKNAAQAILASTLGVVDSILHFFYGIIFS